MAVSWWGNIESNDSAGNVCGMYMYMYMYVHAFKRKGECHRSWQWLQVPHNSPKVHMGAATDIYAHVLSLITTIYRGKFLLLIFGACNFTHRLAIRHRRPMCIYFFFRYNFHYNSTWQYTDNYKTIAYLVLEMMSNSKLKP